MLRCILLDLAIAAVVAVVGLVFFDDASFAWKLAAATLAGLLAADLIRSLIARRQRNG